MFGDVKLNSLVMYVSFEADAKSFVYLTVCVFIGGEGPAQDKDYELRCYHSFCDCVVFFLTVQNQLETSTD